MENYCVWNGQWFETLNFDILEDNINFGSFLKWYNKVYGNAQCVEYIFGISLNKHLSQHTLKIFDWGKYKWVIGFDYG